MPDLDKQIVDGAQMVSLLLVFLSVLFGIKYDAIIGLIGEDQPLAAKTEKRKDFRDRLLRSIVRDLSPIAAPSIVLVALLAPDAFRIASAGSLAYPNFDLVRTLFILVTIAVGLAVIWCCWAAVSLLARWRSAL